MKPVPAIIAPENIFFIREINQPYFSSEFHFHEECQLAYIIQGSGKRIIADSIANFEENELVFIGSNVPHVWYNTEKGIAAHKNKQSVSLSLFISQKLFLEHLKPFGDIHKIEKLFEKAQRGMFLKGTSKLKLIGLLETASVENGVQRIITILSIIHILSTTEEYELLSSGNYINNFQYPESERMNNVYEFIMKNFKKEIALSEVANVAAMNRHAFCRFFKSRMQKSLTQFINEVRIGHACKLLSSKHKSIAQVAHDCGFNNVSNFNRFFKIVKKISPREYRKEMRVD